MKKLSPLFAILLLCYYNTLNAQNYAWVKKISDESVDKSNETMGMTTDPSGNVGLIGSFHQSMSLTPVVLTSSNNSFEPYVVKADSNGKGIWAKSINVLSQGSVYIMNICSDDAGNFYVGGTFKVPIKIDGITLTPLTNSEESFFYAKYNAAGVAQWAESFSAEFLYTDRFSGVSGTVIPEDMHADKTGNLYMSIRFSGVLKFSNDSFTSKYKHIMLAKVNASTGALISHNMIKQTVSNDYSTYLTTDSAGALYITRSFSDTAFLGNTFVKSTGNSDILLAKYVADTLAWVKLFGGKQNDIVNGLNITKDNHIFLSGTCSDTTLFGTITLSGKTHFILKADGAGNPLWAKSIGTGNVQPKNITTDKFGRIFISGSYSGAVSIGLYSGTASMANVFIAHLSDTGTVQWVLSSQGTSSVYLNYMKSLSVDNKGSIYFGGWANYSNAFGTYSFSAPSDMPYGYLGRIKDNGFTIIPPPPPPTGINEWTNETTLFSIYPNPSDGTFSIQLSEKVKAGSSIDIVNMLGQYMETIEVNTNDIQQGFVSANMKQLSKGLYYAILQTGEERPSHQPFIIR